ncbi:MAG TPA: MarR family transcriptional regulator [Actinomycetota bacterium]|jgi:DNA-binding MarR family transcriptional regulator|nr:MarR family transcriptional regulator [Actinomycetota bacterium]
MKRAPATERDDADFHVECTLKRFPDIDPEVEGAVTRVHKLSRYLDRLMADTTTEFGINPGEYRILVRLLSAPERCLSPGQLSTMLLISSGSMTNRLDRLEKAGLVVRKPDPKDRRAVLVELTDTGAETIVAAVSKQGQREAEVFNTLAPKDLARLNDLLRAIMIAFGERLGPLPPVSPPPD